MVLDKIKDMLEKQLGIDKSKITEDSDIIKDIGADSLDIVEFLMDAENEKTTKTFMANFLIELKILQNLFEFYIGIFFINCLHYFSFFENYAFSAAPERSPVRSFRSCRAFRSCCSSTSRRRSTATRQRAAASRSSSPIRV